MEPLKYISLTEAMKIASSRGVPASRPTVIRWCREMKIGIQFGGAKASWHVDKEKLEALLNGRVLNNAS